MLRKTMIIEPGGGLGNRLLTISSAYNLAKDCGITDIILLWRNNNECGCDFEDVLAGLPVPTKVKTLHFGKQSYKQLVKKGRFLGVFYKFFQMWFYKLFRAWSSRFQLLTYQDMPKEEQKSLKDKALGGKGKYVYIEAYYQFYGDLNLSGISFNKDVMERFESFKDRTGAYDAMHIRRTDNSAAIEKSPTQLFYDKIDEVAKADGCTGNGEDSSANRKKIYIATDDKGILEDLRSRYPNIICSEAREEVSRTSAEGMVFALYEMLILSGAEVLYASYGSTFTVIANAIGGNRMETLIRREQ